MISHWEHSVLQQNSPISCNWFWSVSGFLGTWEKTYWALWKTIWCRGKDEVGLLKEICSVILYMININSEYVDHPQDTCLLHFESIY